MPEPSYVPPMESSGDPDWWNSPEIGAVGSSFAALRELFGKGALLDCSSCIVWQLSVLQASDSDSAGKEQAWTFAAVTDNGVTVTGTLSYPPPGFEPAGFDLLGSNTLEPIPPVEDPEALAGLTAEALTERFGPCHFQMDNELGFEILCWFTEDGQLLTVDIQGEASFAHLWDMCAGLRGTDDAPQPADADLVVIRQEENPTAIENEPRWESFLAAAARGEESEVRLRMVYQTGVWDLNLRYDGKIFTLTDGENVSSYRYLLIDREDEPRAGASFRRATHYLLSDDPDLTWDRYMARIVSSAAPPDDDFAATGLFTVYDN